MNRTGLTALACLLMAGIISGAGADIYGSLGANATQEYQVNLQEDTYTVEFTAPGADWQADVTYIQHC